MTISKKAEYAMRAVTLIARHKQNKPIQIREIAKKESIPIKFLEQILLILKNNGILTSKRGANGGYLLAKSSGNISIGIILEIFDGPFDPVGMKSNKDLCAGLEKCFCDMITLVNNHLNQFTIKEVIEIEEPTDLLAFEI